MSSLTSKHVNISSASGNYWSLLEFALNRDLLIRRWPWYANFLAYMDNQRRQIRDADLGSGFGDSRGWSPSKNFKTCYEMPTVVQDGVTALFGKKCFKSKKFVKKFLDKFPDYDLRMKA